MKLYFAKLGLVVLLLCQQLSARADYRDEILKLARIGQLPLLEKNTVVKQLSSYDTTGGNDDGFSGRFSYIRKENGKLVIADLKGAGIIQRIWTPTPTEDTLQFYFDGESNPRLEIKFIDLFSGKVYPFLRPVVGNEVGGYYCYLPIPYARSCKIVYKGQRMQFYQIQYRELSADNAVASFPTKLSKEEDEALSSVLQLWKKTGNNGVPALPGAATNAITPDEALKKGMHNTAATTSGITHQAAPTSAVPHNAAQANEVPAQIAATTTSIHKVQKNLVLKPGGKATLFQSKRFGRILGIELTPQSTLNDAFKALILTARWDGESVPAINCPLTDFFGYAFGQPSMQSLLLGVSEGLHYSYLPMPFSQGAELSLNYLKVEGLTQSDIPVKLTIYYSNEGLTPDEGKFYAEWRREINPAMGQPYRILQKTGRGHYIGTLLQAQGLHSGMTLFFEGDDQCYVDGELRLHGTGSEDYFNGGWYALPDRWDQAFSLPLHGCLAYSIPLARTGGYRFLLADKISFEKEIQLTIEHGPEHNKVPVDYTSVAMYYCDQPPASNELPARDLLKKVKTPDLLEYWIALLPVKAISSGASVMHTEYKDESTGKNYPVLQLEAGEGGFAKFELEVPENGDYELYMSYLKGPGTCGFAVNQRQIPVSQTLGGAAEKNTFVEKEWIGTLSIKEGTNTITVVLKNTDEEAGVHKFLLHRLYLKKKGGA